jgi:hypothetical protein
MDRADSQGCMKAKATHARRVGSYIFHMWGRHMCNDATLERLRDGASQTLIFSPS